MRFLTALLVLILGCTPVRHTERPDTSQEPKDPTAEATASVPQGPVAHLKFNVDVTETSTQKAISFIQAAALAQVKAIVIELDTPGGSVRAGFRFSKAIEESPTPIVCVVDGEADSMGFYILQSCDIRLMTKRSVLMAHQPSLGGFHRGPQEQWRSAADALKALEWAMIEHMVAKMKVSSQEMFKRISGGQEWWMDWREAVYIGAVQGTVRSVRAVTEALGANQSIPVTEDTSSVAKPE